MADLVSVIVATYERPDALDAVLRSLARQTDDTFEVIVADDGSGPATARVVAEWEPRMRARLAHVWHEDRGFRLAEIRNRAILASGGSYCVFLDGDCLARPHFVAAHRRLAEQGWFVTGNRLLLSQSLSERILTERLEPESWGWSDWLGYRLRGDVNRLSPLATLPLGRLRHLGSARWHGARGSNMAFWREDLERIDGFESDYVGWGREDSDIFARMMHAGARRKDGRFATGVLHLWHPEADRSHLTQNDAHLQQAIASGRVCARRGLSSLGEDFPASRVRERT